MWHRRDHVIRFNSNLNKKWHSISMHKVLGFVHDYVINLLFIMNSLIISEDKLLLTYWENGTNYAAYSSRSLKKNNNGVVLEYDTVKFWSFKNYAN